MVRPNRWEAMLPSWTHGTAITVATEVQRLTRLRPPRQQDAPTHHSIRPDQQIALSIAVSNRICRSSRFLPSFPSRGSCSLPSATAHDNKSAEWYFHCRCVQGGQQLHRRLRQHVDSYNGSACSQRFESEIQQITSLRYKL
jgi:hypothetical protein